MTNLLREPMNKGDNRRWSLGHDQVTIMAKVEDRERQCDVMLMLCYKLVFCSDNIA